MEHSLAGKHPAENFADAPVGSGFHFHIRAHPAHAAAFGYHAFICVERADNCREGFADNVIIHGKSTNILTKEVHKVLSNNKRIKKYYLDNWNLGQTIVELKDNL